MALSETQPRTTTILIDELDASLLKGTPNNFERCPTRLTRAGFQLMHSYDSNACFVGEILLAPCQQSAGCSALCWGDHQTMDVVSS